MPVERKVIHLLFFCFCCKYRIPFNLPILIPCIYFDFNGIANINPLNQQIDTPIFLALTDIIFPIHSRASWKWLLENKIKELTKKCISKSVASIWAEQFIQKPTMRVDFLCFHVKRCENVEVFSRELRKAALQIKDAFYLLQQIFNHRYKTVLFRFFLLPLPRYAA